MIHRGVPSNPYHLTGDIDYERLCADALVAAERRIETRIVDRLNNVMKDQLDALLTEHVDGRVSTAEQKPAMWRSKCWPLEGA